MKANWKTLLIISTAIVLMALLATFLLAKKEEKAESNIQAREKPKGVVAGSTTIEGGDYVERLAKNMRDKGMVLFGSYQSKDSKEQKELFGDAAKYLDYVECDASGPNANPDECIAQNIDIYPTWLFNEKSYSGKKTLAEISSIIGFSE